MSIVNIKNTINNVEIIVIENQGCTDKCLIGTDLMNQIPEFKNSLEMVEETIKSMSDEILSQYPSEFVSNQDLKQIYKINESLSVKKMDQMGENFFNYS